MCVERCVCFEVTFAELKEYAQQNHCGIEELRRTFGCGRGCAMCVPYIQAMLETGRTIFGAGDVGDFRGCEER